MELLLLLVLICLNGLLAMSELAIVSARSVRLEQLAENGSSGAKIALRLARDPNRFLAAVQIGITLIGILAGVLGGATLSEDLAYQLKQIEPLAPYGDALSVFTIVFITTYLSLVVGELIPKRLALQYAETLACWAAPPSLWLARLTSPFVLILSFSTEAVLNLLGVPPERDHSVTEDEIMAMVERGMVSGVVNSVEQDMVEGVFSLDEQRAAAIMTPRAEIVWLDLKQEAHLIRQQILDEPHSVYPVCEGSLDQVVGVLRVRDWIRHVLTDEGGHLRALLQHPLYIPETLPVTKLLERFKISPVNMAIVINEHGSVEGIVTLTDVLEEIVGDMHNEEPDAVQREDGSWLLDGLLTLDKVTDIFPSFAAPEDEKGVYLTLAGFVMTRLGHIPSAADKFEWEHLTFEVVDMDGNRVDKVLVQKVDPA